MDSRVRRFLPSRNVRWAAMRAMVGLRLGGLNENGESSARRRCVMPDGNPGLHLVRGAHLRLPGATICHRFAVFEERYHLGAMGDFG